MQLVREPAELQKNAGIDILTFEKWERRDPSDPPPVADAPAINSEYERLWSHISKVILMVTLL